MNYLSKKVGTWLALFRLVIAIGPILIGDIITRKITVTRIDNDESDETLEELIEAATKDGEEIAENVKALHKAIQPSDESSE